jgi:hypothetical protein
MLVEICQQWDFRILYARRNISTVVISGFDIWDCVVLFFSLVCCERHLFCNTRRPSNTAKVSAKTATKPLNKQISYTLRSISHTKNRLRNEWEKLGCRIQTRLCWLAAWRIRLKVGLLYFTTSHHLVPSTTTPTMSSSPNATIHKPPFRPTVTRPSVIFYGAIQREPAWQTSLAASLSDLPIDILDPRRDDWDSTWVEDISFPKFKEQVEWEMDYAKVADVVIFYFAPEAIKRGMCR